MKYEKKLPSSFTWHRDSSVAFAFRKDDIILDRMDKLLDHYWATRDESKKFIFLCDLFFTADYWLKIYKTRGSMEKGRQPAVYALFVCAAELLCVAFKCTINGLPRELELMWGRELSAQGVWVDQVHDLAQYLDSTEVARYRLWFKGGKAYQLPWWNPAAEQEPQLADSMHAYDPGAMATNDSCLPAPDYGFFVLTMSRDLYMAKHHATDGKRGSGFYHSSYVGGSPVQCSGTMLIKMGRITNIRFNSGLYKPQLNNYRALIMALRMWAVPVNAIKFESFNGQPWGGTGTVESVVAASNSRSELENGREQTIVANIAAHGKKPAVDLSKSPNPRDWWGNRPKLPEVQPPALRRA